MSIIFTDSFQNYTYLPLKWEEHTKDCCFTIEPSVGRKGGYGLTATANYMDQTYDHIGRVFDSTMEEVILGFALKKVELDTGYIEVMFNHVEETQSKIRFYSNNFIWLKGDETIDYGMPKSLQFDEWNYIEVKVKTHTVSGTLEVRINEYTAISLTDLSTATTVDYIDRVRFRSMHVYDTDRHFAYIDDLYISNTTGAYNNDFMGNCEIAVVYPIGQAEKSDFLLPPTISGVENYTQVDDERYQNDPTLYSNYFLEYEGDDDGTVWWSGTSEAYNNDQTTMCHQDSYYDGSSYKNYFHWRFSYVNIPRYAIIQRAWIDVYVHSSTISYPQNTTNEIYAYKSGTDPGKFTTKEEVKAAPWTNNYVYSYGAGAPLDGVDISATIQELVSRSDWEEDDNAIVMIQRVAVSTGNENWASLRYRAYEYYNDPFHVDSPRLFVEWTNPGGDNGNYLYSQELGDEETYDFSTVDNPAGIIAISHNVFSKRNLQTANTDDMSFRTLTNLNGTTYSGVKNLPTDRYYTCCTVVDDVNPSTMLPWQPSDLTDTKFGYVTTLSG